MTRTLCILAWLLLNLLRGDRRRFALTLYQFQIHLFEGMGGHFHRADGCACLHEGAHQRRILLIGMRETDGEGTLGGRRSLNKGQSTNGLEPVRCVSDDMHLGARSKHAST